MYKVLGVKPLPVEGESAVGALRRVSVLAKLPVSSLKAAFQATSLCIHPDKCQHPSANKAQQWANAAWTQLSNPVARAAHDSYQRGELEKAIETERKAQGYWPQTSSSSTLRNSSYDGFCLP